jgi:predicted RNase H-like HicB family nuclease
MRIYTAVIERDTTTQLYVGYVPGWSGAHSQARTLAELETHLREVVSLLLADGEPNRDSELVGTRSIAVP